jgi:hypothetical protein
MAGERAVTDWALTDRTRALAAGLPVSFVALLLYARTLLPDVGLWDTAEYQAIGPVLGIAHPTGFPSYTLLAWLASVVLQPFGNEALRANLLSALLVAGSAGIAAAVVALLSRRALVGAAAGLAFALSATVWAVGLRADAHALHIFLAALLLLVLVVWGRRERAGQPADRWLLASAVLFGVALGNHALTVLLAPGIALYVLWISPRLLIDRPRFVATCALALVGTTVLLYLYLPLRSAMNPPLDYAHPATWEDFRYLVLAEQFRGSFQAMPQPAVALRTIAGQTLADLGLFAMLALPGLAVAIRRLPGLALLLFGWFAFNWYFALGYINADIERYYLVPTLSAAVLGGIAAGAAWDWVAGNLAPRATDALARARAPEVAGSLLRALGLTVAAVVLLGTTLIAVPQRYRVVDLSDYLFGRQWLEAVLPALEPDSVVVSWWGYSTPLWYAQLIEDRRPDVAVIDDRTRLDQRLGTATDVIERYLDERPVYLIRLPRDIPALEDSYVLTILPQAPMWGPVYRVDGRRGGPAMRAPMIRP